MQTLILIVVKSLHIQFVELLKFTRSHLQERAQSVGSQIQQWPQYSVTLSNSKSFSPFTVHQMRVPPRAHEEKGGCDNVCKTPIYVKAVKNIITDIIIHLWNINIAYSKPRPYSSCV